MKVSKFYDLLIFEINDKIEILVEKNIIQKWVNLEDWKLQEKLEKEVLNYPVNDEVVKEVKKLLV